MAHMALEPEQQDELVREVGGELVSTASGGWDELRLVFAATVPVQRARFEKVSEDGEVELLAASNAVMDKMSELRSGMYRAGVGTWFTARCVIERSGSYNIEFDYENEPEFVPSLTGSAFAADLEAFPRDGQYIPEWLRRKISEG